MTYNGRLGIETEMEGKVEREKAIEEVKKILAQYASSNMSLTETALLITSMFFQEIERIKEQDK